MVYITQVNSTFRARWLVNSEVISKVYTIHLRAALRETKWLPVSLRLSKVMFWSAGYVVYTKTIIHFSVDESGEYIGLISTIFFLFFMGYVAYH